MDGQTRRAFCGILFFLKCLLSLSISFGLLGYYSSVIYQRYQFGSYERQLREERDRTGYSPPVVEFRPGQCNAVAGSSNLQGSRRISSGHRLEPPDGTAYYGFSLDFSKDTVAQLVQRIGFHPAVINAFTVINSSYYDKSQINWWANQTGDIKGILQLTLDPNENVNTMDTTIFDEFARYISFINSQYGVPILIRFGHEMNGNWRLDYSLKPTGYVRAFRSLHNALITYTNMTALLWSPNIGVGYPYGATVELPAAGTPDFQALDTNNDGTIDISDDPYLPFYPGDDYVDWVGLSFYQYSINQITATDYFTTNIGSVAGASRNDFYGRFSNARGKPMAFGESGSPITPSLANGNTELQIKQSWWSSMFAVGATGSSPAYPNLKLYVQFEEEKVETFFASTGSVTARKDYRISYDNTVKSAFVTDYQANSVFRSAGKLAYSCTGQISLK